MSHLQVNYQLCFRPLYVLIITTHSDIYPPPFPPFSASTCLCLGLPKSSEQAYIEFESIEAIVKTASRTKFFIEFYSTCLEGEVHIHQNPPGVTAQTGWM